MRLINKSTSHTGGIMKTLLILVIGVISLSGVAQAQSFQVGQINAAGNGCVSGNISLSVNQKGLVVSYPEMKIRPDILKRIDRISCNLAIPMSLPPGYRIVASAISNGVSSVVKGDRAEVNQEIFTAGSRGAVKKAALTSATRVFVLKSGAAAVKTACGQQVILRTNLSATLIKADSASQSAIDVRSTQLSIQVVPCQ